MALGILSLSLALSLNSSSTEVEAEEAGEEMDEGEAEEEEEEKEKDDNDDEASASAADDEEEEEGRSKAVTAFRFLAIKASRSRPRIVERGREKEGFRGATGEGEEGRAAAPPGEDEAKDEEVEGAMAAQIRSERRTNKNEQKFNPRGRIGMGGKRRQKKCRQTRRSGNRRK